MFGAFGGGDARALVEVIAEDAVWRVPGTAPVSREYRGREAIFGLFRETRRLTDGTYRTELRWALADDERAVAVYRARGRARRPRARHRPGAAVDAPRRALAEIVAVPTDPAAFDAFWGDAAPAAEAVTIPSRTPCKIARRD